MKKRDTWKQPTPLMQLISVIGSMEGHFSNWSENIISNDIYLEHGLDGYEELRELIPFVDNGSWEMPVRCDFCSEQQPSTYKASEAGWIPSYYELNSDDEIFSPVCPDCQSKHLQRNPLDGEFELKGGRLS